MGGIGGGEEGGDQPPCLSGTSRKIMAFGTRTIMKEVDIYFSDCIRMYGIKKRKKYNKKNILFEIYGITTINKKTPL